MRSPGSAAPRPGSSSPRSAPTWPGSRAPRTWRRGRSSAPAPASPPAAPSAPAPPATGTSTWLEPWAKRRSAPPRPTPSSVSGTAGSRADEARREPSSHSDAQSWSSSGTCSTIPTRTSATSDPTSTTDTAAPNAPSDPTSASSKPWATRSASNPPPDPRTSRTPSPAPPDAFGLPTHHAFSDQRFLLARGGGARAGVRQDARAARRPLAGEPGEQLRVRRAHVPAPVVGHQLVGACVVAPQAGRPARPQLALGQLADRRVPRQLDPLERVRRQPVAGQERRREHALVDDLQHAADVEDDSADHRPGPVPGALTAPVRARTCACSAVNRASSTVLPVCRRPRTA